VTPSCTRALCVTVAFLTAGASRPPEKPRVKDLLQRTAAYVDRYHREFESVIGEERYVQEVQVPRVRGGTGIWTTRARRVITSEIVLVWLPGDRDWVGFRDVLTVDDQPVADAGQRKERLLSSLAQDRPGMLRALAAESARYNLGPIARNFNDPLLPLLFLWSRHQSRFKFEIKAPAPKAGTPAWRVKYEERDRPTLIRAVTFDSPSRGEFWIDNETGALIRSEHEVGEDNVDVHARTIIDYRFEPRFGLWVPAEMTELYTHPRRPWTQRTSCTARYSNFRRFETDVRILPPSPGGGAARP
jgi:hypothetical protein